MQFDFQAARSFLSRFAEDLVVTFQVFDDRKQGGRAFHFTADFDIAADTLEGENRQNLGVYFMVNEGNGKGRSNSNVIKIRSLFVDLDGAPLAPVLTAALEPHIIVESSPGRYQAYWLVDDCPIERFTSLQKALARKFQSDASITELARVMRVPGFFHCKKDPILVRILIDNGGVPYRMEQIVSRLSLQEYEEAIDMEAGQPLDNIADLLKKKIPAGARHETLKSYAVKYAHLAYSKGEVLAMLHGINRVACIEPKPDNEIERLVDWACSVAGPSVDISGMLETVIWGKGKEADTANDSFSLPEKLLNSAPGLVGEISAWINQGAMYYQPALALGAALAFVGALKGQRVRSPTNLRTNNYLLGIAPSGAGKNHAPECIEQVVTTAGLDNLVGGKPASDAGVLKMLGGYGRRYLHWDEIGPALMEITSPRAGGHKAGILRVLMELFSKAGGIYRGYQYADHDGKMGRVDLLQVCLSVYGTSTPDKLFKSLSSDYVSDGFLPRWLILESPERNPKRRKATSTDIPQPIIRDILRIEKMPTNVNPRGDLAMLVIDPQVIPFAQSAQEVLDDAVDTFDRIRVEAQGDALQAIWARAAEHAIKVALTVEDGPTITRETLEWALELVTAATRNTCRIVETRIAENAYHEKLNWVLGIISKAGKEGIRAAELSKKLSRLPRSWKNDILGSLQESEQIEIIKESGTTKPKTIYRMVRG